LPEEIRFELLEDRYSRQRLIASWDQEKLARASVLVAGAGALGNEALKNLALLGVGKILIVDFDCIEISNLSRSVLFRDEDIGQSKAVTAAAAVGRLNPEMEVEAMDGDLECDLGLGRIRECDLVLGCLDSIYARWVLNRACRRAGRAWINAGINAGVGEVSLFAPDTGACYECGMNRQMWEQIHERRSCMLLPKTMPPRMIPSTAIIASLTAALQVNEALQWIHGEGHLGPGETLLLSLSPYSLSTFGTKPKPDCLAHDSCAPSIFVAAEPGEITAAELLDQIPGAASLQLDFDLVESWVCVNCGRERAGRRLSRALARDVSCPQCNGERRPQLVHEINRCDWMADLSLAELGVPPRAILGVTIESGTAYVELIRSREWQPSPSRS
jgi:adenylyltransferase/sulfurtransferase